MAPKKSKAAKAEEQAEDAGVEPQQAASKDKSKIPGGKAGGAASGETCHTQSTTYSCAILFHNAYTEPSSCACLTENTPKALACLKLRTELARSGLA